MSARKPQRVVVFLDEKNAYKGARRAFYTPMDHHTCGMFQPMALGSTLCSRQPHGVKEERQLTEVRLYTGTPNPNMDPKSHAAHIRQCQAWETAGATVISRPLRYKNGQPPGEQKGVDVALAVDFVTLAVRGEYDIGIIFSTDTDLKPALEFVLTLTGTPRAEVACWWSPAAQQYLSIAGTVIWSHRLEKNDYQAVADYTNYSS